MIYLFRVSNVNYHLEVDHFRPVVLSGRRNFDQLVKVSIWVKSCFVVASPRTRRSLVVLNSFSTRAKFVGKAIFMALSSE